MCSNSSPYQSFVYHQYWEQSNRTNQRDMQKCLNSANLHMFGLEGVSHLRLIWVWGCDLHFSHLDTIKNGIFLLSSKEIGTQILEQIWKLNIIPVNRTLAFPWDNVEFVPEKGTAALQFLKIIRDKNTSQATSYCDILKGDFL